MLKATLLVFGVCAVAAAAAADFAVLIKSPAGEEKVEPTPDGAGLVDGGANETGVFVIAMFELVAVCA